MDNQFDFWMITVKCSHKTPVKAFKSDNGIVFDIDSIRSGWKQYGRNTYPVMCHSLTVAFIDATAGKDAASAELAKWEKIATDGQYPVRVVMTYEARD